MEGPTASPKIDCDIDDLLDEAYAMSLSVAVNPRKVTTVINRLRECADQARDAGLSNAEQRMRTAAENLEKRFSNGR